MSLAAQRARDQGVPSHKQVPECSKVRAKDHRDQDGGGRTGSGCSWSRDLGPWEAASGR